MGERDDDGLYPHAEDVRVDGDEDAATLAVPEPPDFAAPPVAIKPLAELRPTIDLTPSGVSQPSVAPQVRMVSESSVPDSLVGTMLAGRYRIDRVVARGGMGRVYSATQLPLERRVAVKVLAPKSDTTSDPHFVRRFFLEASVCARLSHPNIVTVHDYGEADDGLLFMAMEYLDGPTLATVIKEEGALAPERVLSIAMQVCRGLREAHGRGIVHRDLKPGNIILLRSADEDTSELVKVLDFGLVKVFEPEPDAGGTGSLARDLADFDLTRAGIMLGSPRYMSPEQIRNEPLDPRTDIYSLGVILYQMTSGRAPFNGKTSVDILHQHMHQAPAPIDGCAPELAAVIFRCLSKAREERYSSINELLRDLKSVYRGLAGHTPAAPRFGSVLPDPSLSASQSSLVGRIERDVDRSDSRRQAALPAAAFAEPLAVSDAISFEEPRSVGAGDIQTMDFSGARPLRPAPGASDAPASSRSLAVGAIALLVLSSVGGALALVLGREPEPPAPVAAPTPAVTTPAREPPPAQRPTLVVDSRPQGATVLEGGRALGTTPLALTLDPDASALRRFELRLDGFETLELVQPPTRQDARLEVELVARVDVKEPEAAKPGRTKTKTTKPAKTTEEPPADIRLSR
ncbi:protein kinase [Myxococcota bacterium]|nr:protein kinase [Myxococcota bacterium]